MNKDSREKFDTILRCMKEHASWYIVCHENPDGDTLGCALVLYSFAARNGKKAVVTGRSPFPERYQFLPYASVYEQNVSLPDREESGVLVLCVDTSTEERSIEWVSGIKNTKLSSINIDHHMDNTMYCKINCIVPDASATAEIVIDLLDYSGCGITEDESIALYSALSTDNGNFRYNSTTAHTHICAAKLHEAGLKPADVDDKINENLSADVLKLWGTAFSRTELVCGGKGALFYVTAADIDKAGADLSSLDGLVNMLLRIKGVKVAAFLTETGETCKVSIRSREPYSARELAAVFGGGGHMMAAGAKIAGTVKEALPKIKKEMEQYIDFGHITD